MKKLLFPLLLISISCFSQDNGRISQSTYLTIWYKVLPNNQYDIFFQNGNKDTSIIQYTLNDTTYNVRLGHWEKHQFIMYQPKGFTLSAKNMNHYLAKWQECGSKRQSEKVIYNLIKSPLLNTSCNGKTIINYPFFDSNSRVH